MGLFRGAKVLGPLWYEKNNQVILTSFKQRYSKYGRLGGSAFHGS